MDNEAVNKAVGYLRVSTQGQVDGTSPEEQRIAIKNECQRSGFELVDFYSDFAFSGSDDNRPGLQSLLQEARTGKFKIVLFTQLDRLGRNLRDIKNILYEISNGGLKYICVQQPEITNQNEDKGEFFTNILGSFAELEGKMIKDRMNRGKINRWKKGDGAIGSLPLGYTRKNGKIEIDPKKQKIYLKIVPMYLDQNYSLKDIAIKLTADGIPSPSPRTNKWNNVTVSEILKNPAYTGQAIQNRYKFIRKQSRSKGRQYYCISKEEKPKKEWIIIKYPPLISKERFNQIQARIENQKHKPKKHHVGYEDRFMAENVLFCGYCGTKIRKRKTHIANFFYSCYWWGASNTNKERQMLQHKKCLLGTIDADIIDERIFDEIVKVISNPSRFAKDWLKDENVEELKNKVETLKTHEKEFEIRVRKGFKHITNNENSQLQKIYQAELEKIEKDFRINHQNLKMAEADLNFAQNKYDRLANFNEALNKGGVKGMRAWFKTKSTLEKFLYSLPFQEKKRITEAIVSPETGGKIFIRYGTAFDYIAEEEGTRKISNEELHMPRPDLDPVLEMDFNIDLNKIESLITSLNKKEFLNKFTLRRNTCTGQNRNVTG